MSCRARLHHAFVGVPCDPANSYLLLNGEVGPPDHKSEVDARALQLGGSPFDGGSVMWWNFLGRDQGEVVAFRDAWQDESDQFGHVQG